jgi:uncharacterized membrane-anchored protein
MRYISFTWFALTLLLTGLTYIFLGLNYEQSIHRAAVVFSASVAVYTIVMLLYWFLKQKKSI